MGRHGRLDAFGRAKELRQKAEGRRQKAEGRTTTGLSWIAESGTQITRKVRVETVLVAACVVAFATTARAARTPVRNSAPQQGSSESTQHRSGVASPRANSSQIPEASDLKKLYDAGKWKDVVRLAPTGAAAPPDADFYRGLALAKLRRWSESRAALAAGETKSPKDERFPVELAGVGYEQKDFRFAEGELRRALRIKPHDTYALNFLATIYFLRGNLAAALEYWNREELPRVHEIKESPEPNLRAELFSRAFAFAPLSTLELSQFETTQAYLDNLGVFALYRWELAPVEGNSVGAGDTASPTTFDVVFHSVQRDGFGPNKWAGALSMLRGLPYETIYPEYDDAFRDAVNFTSLVRFDSQKERVYAQISAPLQERPSWRVRAWVDGRDEHWNITNTLFGAPTPISNLKLRKIEAGAGFRSVQNGRWSWETAASFAYRDFRVQSGETIGSLASAASVFFTDGDSLELSARTNYRLLWIPQDRIRLDTSADGLIGRFFSAPLGSYEEVGGSAGLDWLPEEQGNDWETLSRLRTGGTFGAVPFDDLFTLGVERDDNNLWLRGISATHEGRKGKSPMGRDYILWNSEIDKIVYNGALVQVRVGPLFDAGRIWDPSGLFGSGGWLWDPGAQVKIRVLDTFDVVFSYGHDMRSGENTFFGGTQQ
jgi:Flp pilus assembly protein TadD